MENHTAQKRQRARSDADIVSEAGNYAKRAQRPFSQPACTVGHATATGFARMLNGHVHGDNIHGNVNTTINNFHAGDHESSKLAAGPETPGILSESERKDLLERLRFPQLDARLTNLRKAESRTCDWIMQRKDYIEWLRSDDLKACNGFFWIKGNPGTGKSITMKFLYQRMQRQLRNVKSKDKLVISFFFNARGNKFEKSTLGLYRSLLFSLLTLEPNLHEAFDHCQRGGYHNIIESDWQLQMLKEVFEEAVTLLQARGKKLYCFVDALDECPEDDVQDMVSYFEDLAGKTDSRHFRICFSSRHYPQISIRTKLTMVLEKERNHDEDIRIFIESRLRFDGDVDAELLRQIRAEILEKSSGIFLWVNLVVYQLNEVQRQDGRMKAVHRRLREIPEAAKQRPAPNGAMPLYGLFDDIIQKDQRNIDKLVQITQIVFCARRPLHPKELYILLHEEYDAPFDASEISDKVLTKHVLEVSKGLAEVTKSEEPTVQFIHETVREFLRDGGLKNICTQSIDRDGHEFMRASCLKQIHAPVSEHLELLAEYQRRGQYRNTKVHEITRERQQEFRHEANAKFPFLEYASKNVLFHADEAKYMGVSQIEFLESFPTAEWIPIYNLFQKYNTRRYSEATTPLLYILAEHGCDHLIENSHFSGQYLHEVKGNEFSSALSCAIYNGRLDTAWTLAGLKPQSRPQNIVQPSKVYHRPGQLWLLRVLFRFGDVHLMRRVLEDSNSMKNLVATELGFIECISSEMIDLLVELSLVPDFPSLDHLHKLPQADQASPEHQRSNTDLISIRRAIEEEPSLLKSSSWSGRTMLKYAVKERFQPLVSLYVEYSDHGRSDIDAVLHHAAALGDLGTIKFADRCGANLDSQDEDGRTALHLAAEFLVGYRGHEKPLQYLLSKEPSCVNVRDGANRTALAVAAARVFQVDGLSDLFDTFLHAGADPNTVIKCHECNNHHELPLLVLMTIRGDVVTSHRLGCDDRCDLNGRDSFGKTALSWCFVLQRNFEFLYHASINDDCAGMIGKRLLQQPAVDVNSRDNFGYTILEHLIRYACPFEDNPRPEFQSFVHKFFQSDQLDPNIRTSNQQTPLELIVSLHDTWPDEFRLVDLCVYSDFYKDFERERRQQLFNRHLIQALRLLLGTGRVDVDVQRRCAYAEKTAPELRSIILGSIEYILSRGSC